MPHKLIPELVCGARESTLRSGPSNPRTALPRKPMHPAGNASKSRKRMSGS
ncbi:hypothetical protein PT2222_50028 [Paraburkholderia tropica]